MTPKAGGALTSAVAASGTRANLHGSLFMVTAMALFAVEDMLLKAATKTVPVGQVLIVFGAGGMFLFALLAKSQGQRILHPAILSRPILLRCVFEVTGRLFYTLAIVLTTLSSAAAILQATPLVVIAGAAILFGEKVSLARWAAVVIGLLGVLVILRPGADGFSSLSILAIIGTIGFAGRDLATRAAPRVLSNWQLGIYGFALMIPAGAGLLAWSGGAVVPDQFALLCLLTAIVTGVGAYAALTQAMRTGEVSVVAPFRYSRLLFAILLGVIVFGERPDMATMIGGAIVVCSGIFALTLGRRT